MKNRLNFQILPWVVLFLGATAALLRIWLYATGMQEQGLLARFHIADILCWVLTALTMGLILFGSFLQPKDQPYHLLFPVSYPGFLGAEAAAIGVALSSVWALMQKPDTLGMVAACMGIPAAISLFLLGIFRKDGKQPVVVLHCVICLYLMVQLICDYRIWSARPQIQSYGFALLALVCLMVSTYQRAKFDANCGNCRSYTVFRLAAVYFCVACLPHSDRPVFFLTMALWAVTDLCEPMPMPTVGEAEHEYA